MVNYHRAARTRTSKLSVSRLIRQPSVSGRGRAAHSGIRLMSNCISVRAAIFRAFTVLTSFYEITLRGRGRSFPQVVCVIGNLDNRRVSEARGIVRTLLPATCPSGIKFRIRVFFFLFFFCTKPCAAVTGASASCAAKVSMFVYPNTLLQKLYKRYPAVSCTNFGI